jgi:hypothetical protein
MGERVTSPPLRSFQDHDIIGGEIDFGGGKGVCRGGEVVYSFIVRGQQLSFEGGRKFMTSKIDARFNNEVDFSIGLSGE